MSDIHAIISELDAYCAETGLSPATVCNRARNNARLYDRLKTRAEKLDEDVSVDFHPEVTRVFHREVTHL